MLGKGGFSAAVATENRNHTPGFNCEVHILEHDRTGRIVKPLVSKTKMLRFDDLAHVAASVQGVQRPVEPQGSIRPDSRTGRPSSPTVV